MIISKFYSCILNFTSFTGFGITNEDSRAVTIFTFVVLMNIVTVLGLLGVRVLEFNKFLLVFIFLGSFYVFYKLFSNENRKEKISRNYNIMGIKEKLIMNIASVIYIIFSVVFFLKVV